jgi:hypothetical protein
MTDMQNSLFCIWSESLSLKKYFQALLDKESENQATLKVGISTLRNGQIESIYADDAETLLTHPLGKLSLVSICPYPKTASEILTIPPFTRPNIAVAYIGTIFNPNAIWGRRILPKQYQLFTPTVEESLVYVINEYLEETDLPPNLIIAHLVERLRGDFTLMVLFAQSEVIMMAQCGYPLFFSDDDETIFLREIKRH